jgi:hypothetical protein
MAEQNEWWDKQHRDDARRFKRRLERLLLEMAECDVELHSCCSGSTVSLHISPRGWDEEEWQRQQFAKEVNGDGGRVTVKDPSRAWRGEYTP